MDVAPVGLKDGALAGVEEVTVEHRDPGPVPHQPTRAPVSHSTKRAAEEEGAGTRDRVRPATLLELAVLGQETGLAPFSDEDVPEHAPPDRDIDMRWPGEIVCEIDLG
jgi:hypothetical protein